VRLTDLIKRHEALNFLLPVEKKPRFGNNRVAVTRSAADKLAVVFNSILRRTKNREQSQRFTLQCLVAMVSEDVGLLPSGIFLDILEECDSAAKSYDLIGNLFNQMNSERAAQGGRYRNVPYFNGGLFQEIDPVELTGGEVLLLMHAANEDWGKVQPAIFGSLFESSMGKEERHAQGAHFTSEADIQKVVLPTIVRPFRRRLEDAATLKELMVLREAIQRFRVLDPACGSGNFLYVAYRELSRIGLDLIARVHANFGVDAARKIGFGSQLGTQQFYGIDHTPFAAELTKVTLALAKEFSLMEGQERFREFQGDLLNQALPLDNLDSNVACKRRAVHNMAGSRRNNRKPSLSVKEQHAAGTRSRLLEETSKRVSRYSGSSRLLRLLVPQSARHSQDWAAGWTRGYKHNQTELCSRGRPRLYRPTQWDYYRGRFLAALVRGSLSARLDSKLD